MTNERPVHIISLGAGVQSSTMALMAAKGEITPMPIAAVFADTGDEPSEVYEWLNTLIPMLPFQVIVWNRKIKGISAGRLSDHIREAGHTEIPCFVRGSSGKASIGKRQCTRNWKIRPISQAIRASTGTQSLRLQAGSFVQWIGISVDEAVRAKDSRYPHTIHRFPLLEKGMNRRNCVEWLSKHGLEAPKSACVYCPFRTRAQWRASKLKGGVEWDLIRKVSKQLADNGEYLTSDLLPIDQVDFSTEEERGQLNMFENECEGMCGV